MREDMFKVIVERPRAGWRSRPHKRPHVLDEDALPVKIGVKRHVAEMRIRSKGLNENLQPLKRYLGRQVGRPWDIVYSEISATLAPGHTVKEHVRLHIRDFVVRDLLIGPNGELERPHRDRHGMRLPWHQPYYVDPSDGLLKDSARRWQSLGLHPNPWRREKPKPDPNIRRIDDARDLRRIAGIWYEVGCEQKPDALGWAVDLIERKLVPARDRHAVSKRQLSRAELMAFGVANA